MRDPNITAVATGLGFIEGPMEMPDGRIMFTDVGAGQLMTYDPDSGVVAHFAKTLGGTNSVARGPDGAFYVCNNGGLSMARSPEGYQIPLAGTHGDAPIAACIQRVTEDGHVQALYTSCNGRPLVAPNDLVFDAHGGFYFTDSGEPSGRLVDLGGLYYAKADGSEIVELIHEPAPHAPLSQPNGCGLSPDGSRLYVAESSSGRVWYWEIEAPGRLKADKNSFISNGAKLLFSADDYIIFDSLAVDASGNVCVGTCLRGDISVITSEGELDRAIALPKFDPFPTNICFAGPELKYAYVTAAGTGVLYRIPWPCGGLRLNYSS